MREVGHADNLLVHVSLGTMDLRPEFGHSVSRSRISSTADANRSPNPDCRSPYPTRMVERSGHRFQTVHGDFDR
jgi:hypothetical protein